MPGGSLLCCGVCYAVRGTRWQTGQMTEVSGRRRIVVTGGSRGIGAAICQAFAQLGDAVAVHCGASRDAANALVVSLAGSGHVVAQADLRDPDAIRVMVDDVAAALGGIDVLVNNAGVFVAHEIDKVTYEEWQQAWANTLGVNLVGAANVTWCAVRHNTRRLSAHRECRVTRGVPWRAEVPGLRGEQGSTRRLRTVARQGARVIRCGRDDGRSGLRGDRYGGRVPDDHDRPSPEKQRQARGRARSGPTCGPGLSSGQVLDPRLRKRVARRRLDRSRRHACARGCGDHGRRERLIEVPQDVLEVLESHADAHQVLGHAHGRPRVAGGWSIRGGSPGSGRLRR